MARLAATSRFERSYKKLPKPLREAVDRALVKLLEQPPRPSLHLEPLQGRDGYWKIRVNRGHRVLLRIEGSGDGRRFVLADVGPHDLYKQRS